MHRFDPSKFFIYQLVCLVLFGLWDLFLGWLFDFKLAMAASSNGTFGNSVYSKYMVGGNREAYKYRSSMSNGCISGVST